MQICVAGWYVFEDLMSQLNSVLPKYSVHFVVNDKRYTAIKDQVDSSLGDIPLVLTPNGGLEFGLYDHFLKNVWDKTSSVLFMHDDIILDSLGCFEEIEEADCDQGYIFRNEACSRANSHIHGRGIFCRPGVLHACLRYVCRCPEAKDRVDKRLSLHTLPGCGPHSGIWFDPRNFTYVSGGPPRGLRHYNAAVYHFAMVMGRLRKKDGNPYKTKEAIYIPGFNHFRRGVEMNSTWRRK